MPIIRKDPKLEAERYFEENHLHELISVPFQLVINYRN